MREPVDLERLARAKYLSPLDVHFARTLLGLWDPGPDALTRERVALACALVSRHVSAGHVCLSLATLSESPPRISERGDDGQEQVVELAWPSEAQWLSALSQSPLVGGPDAGRPLVLDAHGHLYLRRYFEHEQALVSDLLARVSLSPSSKAPDADLDRYFPPAAAAAERPRQLSLDAEVDLQRQAAAMAVERPFAVITGGPGTGKTSTVVKLLALLVERHLAEQGPAPRIHLLAPTGKAAARLSESIVAARAGLPCEERVRAAIPGQASTIHRALGTLPRGQVGFRHDQRHPLLTDVVLVDEASMVDLSLMRRLLTAIPSTARVILLGDRDQLASVEAGAVLGDVCGAGLSAEERRDSPMAACHVHLTRSYRYRAQSGIGRLAEAIRGRRAAEALSLLEKARYRDVVLCPPPTPLGLGEHLQREALLAYAGLSDLTVPDAAFAVLARYRVLCAHRRGPLGVEAINARIAEALHAAGHLSSLSVDAPGRPILITQNDYPLRLFNGDIGVLLRVDGRVRAHFADGEGGTQRLAPRRLPPHESVYAMSVHKSQGSEMDHVAVVLPQPGSPLLTRELLYTAVTRARERVTLYGTPEAVAAAIETSLTRESGLRRGLWR